jgi:putative phage-type endonuclease
MNSLAESDLEDILDRLVFEDKPPIFTEDYALQLVDSALHLMDEYMIVNPQLIFQPNFHSIFINDIRDIFYAQLEDQIDDLDDGDDIEDEMNDLLEDAYRIFISTFYPDKYSNIHQIMDDNNDLSNIDLSNDLSIDLSNDLSIDTEIYDDEKTKMIKEKIEYLRNIPQPVQRTPEWYEFRWNLITASNAWKAFESQSTMNQLIYEKCQPLKQNNIEDDNNVKIINNVNTNSPLHHGQKYEPLTIQIYENQYKTKVEDFGCIKHPIYPFLGASPDGIIVNPESNRYGRMLEIKNVVSREITGIPKKEYWVQMQLQMEVCDLDDCDFVETKFVEYPDYESYINDSAIAYDLSGNEFKSFVTTKNNSYKGTIIYFHTKEGTPYYVYKPINLYLSQDITNWEEENIQKYQTEPYNYTFIKFIYWKVEKFSCVLVLRNREWFKNNIEQLEKIWKTIEQERVTGYEHRAPNKKQKVEIVKPYFNNKSDQGCFLFNNIVRVEQK